MNNINKYAGFTLVEIMVVLAIFTIILLSIYAVMFAGERSWQACSTKIQLQEGLRNATGTFTDELRQSSYTQVSIATNGKSITFSIPVQTTGTQDQESITLQTKGSFPQEVVNYNYPNQTQWGAYKRLVAGQGGTVEYALSGNTLLRIVSGAVIEQYVLARDVDDIKFSQPDKNNNPARINIYVIGRKNTIQNFPLIYKIITSVYCESSSI